MRHQAKQLGRVDLFFVAEDFRFICELKIDSLYQHKQLDRYLKSDAYVVSIVRSARKTPFAQRVIESEYWLGEVTWEQILPGMRGLQFPEEIQGQWLDLLDFLEEDGDFAAQPRSRVTDKDKALSAAVAKRSLEMVAGTPGLRADRRELLHLLEAGPSRGARTFAWTPIVDSQRQTFWETGIRGAGLRTPEVVVNWLPWQPLRHGQRKMHEQLSGFQRMGRRGSEYYRFRRVLAVEPGSDAVRPASEAAAQAIRRTVNVGLVDWDAKQLKKANR